MSASRSAAASGASGCRRAKSPPTCRAMHAGPRTSWKATSCRPTSSTARACACCLANGAAPLRWVQNTMREVDAENHVYEGALEFNVPLLKDVPGFQDLSTNLAGRYTQVFVLRRGRFLEDRTQLADRRFGPVPQHLFVGYPRAEPQRPVPAGRVSPRRASQDRLTGGSNQGMRLVSRGNPHR